jgi:hypothetical protein
MTFPKVPFMARRSHDEYSNSSDERSRDLTAQFWGSSPGWRTTGSVRRVGRNGDRSGPVARTRTHGDRTGQVPLVAAVPVEEPLIDPYDFGFDDVGYGPDPGVAGRRLDNWRRTSADTVAHESPEAIELIELEERRPGRPSDPITALAERLGLGAVDPLLRRLGVIVMIGVLSVPLAMSLRPDPSTGSVTTDVTAMASTELITSGEAPAVDEVAQTLVADSEDPSADLQSSPVQPSAELTAAPSTSPAAVDVATSQPAQTATTVSVGDATESAEDSELDVAETVEAPRATSQPTSEAADADEPANRVAPICALSYTVGAGDYWIRIADAADTTLAKLLQANLATVLTPLYPGDDICLPEGATLPAPPTASTAAPPATAPTATTAPTTTVAPTTPTTSGPVVTAPPAPAAIEAIIREIWPDDLEDRALEIAWRESGYRSNAQNWCCYGLFQINWNAHRSWLDDIGVTSATQLLDARTNARAALALYQRSGGWGPWGG